MRYALLFALLPLAAAAPRATAAPEGLVLRLDAMRPLGEAKPQNGPVAVWRDLSGRGNDVAQPDAALQPRWDGRGADGKPAVVFAGRQRLDGRPVLPEGAKSLTFVAVWRRDAADGSGSIIEQAAEGHGRRAALLTIAGAYGFNGEFNDQHGLWRYRPGRMVVSVVRLEPTGRVTAFHNGYAKSGYVDANLQNTGTALLRVGAKIYGEEFLRGAIAELRVYDRALTDADARAVTAELTRKWGIKVEKSDPDAALYQERLDQNAADPGRFSDVYRPQYHYTTVEGWLNDPNGLVYFRGEWHLFMQHLFAQEMGWGHAVSKDLVHWQHLPPAIAPDEKGAIWSGSAVVDERDTSGFFGGKPGIVCVFTYQNPREGGRQSIGIAYSADGRTFTKYDRNPAIPQLRYIPGQPDVPDFRDPKVFWHAPSKRWVVIVAGGKVRFFSSPNLRDWTFESINEDIETECPDLFPMAIDGDPARVKWVLSGGGRWYQLGDFDGKRFRPDGPRVPFNYGQDFYASQTWSDVPDGRRILTTWMYDWGYSGNFPGRPGGGLTLPVELTLETTPDGPRILQAPARELAKLRSGHTTLAARTIEPGAPTAVPEAAGRQVELVAVFETGGASELGLRVLKSPFGPQTTVGYRAADGKVFIDRGQAGVQGVANWRPSSEAPLAPVNGRVKLHVFVDWSSVDVIANDGRAAITSNVFAPPTATGVELYAVGGQARLVSMDVYPLRSAWRTEAEEKRAKPRLQVAGALEVKVGSRGILGAAIWPYGGAAPRVRWTLSDASAAELTVLDDANVAITPKRPGVVVVTAEADGGLKAECRVTGRE